jgi:transcriptional regulator with XRE-family HTH domain
MEISHKVKLIREDKKFSQEYVSHKLGLSQSQYSRRENGEVKFIAEEIGKLAKILEIPV